MEFFARHVEPIDISLGGLRIHSDEAHPIGSFLPLDIFFPNVPPVTLSARVMWATLLGKGAAARFEVGLAFVELTPYALQLLKRAIGSEGAVPVIGVSEGASARALAHSSVEFISDEPATELHPVTPALRIARRQPDIQSTLSETPVVLVNAEALRAAQLDSRAGFLVSLIDGATTVESLLDLSGMPEQETLALLDHLRSRGIVGLGESDQPNPWVPPHLSVAPRLSLEMWPPSSNAPTARSLRPESLELLAPDATAAGAPSGFRRRVPGAKPQWLLAVAALVLAGGIAAGAIVLPHHLHTLPALATAARSVGPDLEGPTTLQPPVAEQGLPAPSASLPTRDNVAVPIPPPKNRSAPPVARSASAPPVVPNVSAPPVAPSGSAPPVVPSASAPPVAPSASIPPVVPSVSAPPLALSASAPPATPTVSGPPVAPSASAAPVSPKASVSPSSATPSKSIPPTKGLVEIPQSKGHRIYVDGFVVGETPTPVLVNCGQHVVQVGSAGKEQSIDVPCGGSVTVVP